MKRIKNTLIIGGVLLVVFAFTKVQMQSTEWVVPAKYKTMENPTDASDDENIEIGEELYTKHCKSCHGKEGLGDGSKAAEQEGDLGDFSSEEFQAQSDGALFYKTTFGRDDMPNYEKKMPDDEDRWLIVNYMRSLGE
jgi:mono/diheme cytochrome c family protein